MAAVISTGSAPRDLLPGVRKFVGDEYKELKFEYPEIFKMQSSTQAFEIDVLISGLGVAKEKPQGDSISFDSMSQGYEKVYRHKAFANAFAITTEAMEDGKVGVLLRQKSNGLKKSMKAAKEIQAALILDRGFNSSYVGGDSVELFSTAHPTKSSDMANTLATAAAFSESSLEQSVIDVSNMRDNRGIRIEANITKMILPRGLLFSAERVLATKLRPGTSDNDTNAHKSLGLIPGGAVINHHLVDQDAYYFMTDVDQGLLGFERTGLKIEMDNEFNTGNAKFKATERYVFGWTDPRGAFGVPGA